MFSEHSLMSYLLLVLMLVLMMAVTVLRYRMSSILWMARAAKTEHSSAAGNAERNASTVNDAGEATTQTGRQKHQYAQPYA